MAECHIEHPCELCQQQTYDRAAREGARLLRELEISIAVQRATADAQQRAWDELPRWRLIRRWKQRRWQG